VRLLLGGHLGPVDAHVADAGGRADPRLDVGLELRPQRAAGGGQGQGDDDRAVGIDLRATGHAEVDHVGSQLGVDHAAQEVQHLRLGRQGGGDGHASILLREPV
jgi:hypothetical protein